MINKLMWKIKPVERELEREGIEKNQKAPLEILEKCLHGICIHYHYKAQYINPYYEADKFVFYSCSMLNTEDDKTPKWIGNIYAKTYWELVAKQLIKLYGDIRKGK